MRVRCMDRVWELDLPHSEAWVLMAYADHAKPDGSDCRPSADYIAYKTGYSVRQIRRITDQLIARGLLKVIAPGGGHKRPTLYQIEIKGPFKPSFPDWLAGKNTDNMTGKNSVTVTGNNDDNLTGKESYPDMVTVVTLTNEYVYPDIAMSGEPLTVNLKDVDQEDRDFWDVARAHLRLQLPANTYTTWVRDAVGLGLHNGVFLVGVRDGYAWDWMQLRLKPLVLRTLQSLDGQPGREVRDVQFLMQRKEVINGEAGLSGHA